MVDLKPCRVCKTEPDIRGHDAEMGRFILGCSACKVEVYGPTREQRDENWNRWNRRAGWVRVEDGPPEEWRAVIVAGGCAIYKSGHWYSIMDRGLNQPERIEWPVTHWQPLPTPPQEADDEEG